MKPFYSYSFGCRVNQAEKEELDRQLQHRGYTLSKDQPEIVIINSCAVTVKAEREARQLIYQLKRKNPKVKIIITGCAATNWLKIKTKIPEIDLLVDNQNKEYLATLIDKEFRGNNKSLQVSNKLKEYYSSSDSPVGEESRSSRLHQDNLVSARTITNHKYLNSGRMILKIQDGCHRFCTYCIVPYLRGQPKSVPTNQIISKINESSDSLKEVILSSINTEAYGFDTKESFTDLISAVINKTTVDRISSGSINPWSIDQNFVDFYKKIRKSGRMVDFFHIPLQSGSNKILNLMRRGYTREEFKEKLDIIANIDPFIFIGTDIIVGYLDEDEKDFQDSYDLLQNSAINRFHIFRFSKREHTAAFYMSKRLKEPDSQTKIKRAKALNDLNRLKYNRFLQKHLDHTFPALFLERKDKEYNESLLINQIPVLVKTDKELSSQIRNVKIIEYKNGRLFGKIV